MGIPICRDNALGTSLFDALHIMLLDARIDICPAMGLHVRLQVKLRLQS
ncbi:hypothetical protein Tco_1196120, partial [Tanacetum coccineum]